MFDANDVEETDLREVKEDFRGGRGGALVPEVGDIFPFGLGGDSKFMSGAMSCPFALDPSCVGIVSLTSPFLAALCCAKPFGRGGDGPSSTIQSLRSIRDVLRPKLGGEGDGDAGTDCFDVKGGERGVPSIWPLICCFLASGDKGAAVVIDSNAAIRDCKAVEGILKTAWTTSRLVSSWEV